MNHQYFEVIFSIPIELLVQLVFRVRIMTRICTFKLDNIPICWSGQWLMVRFMATSSFKVWFKHKLIKSIKLLASYFSSTKSTSCKSHNLRMLDNNFLKLPINWPAKKHSDFQSRYSALIALYKSLTTNTKEFYSIWVFLNRLIAREFKN